MNLYCGESGKKYKRCCWERDRNARVDGVPEAEPCSDFFDIAELDRLSNGVVDLVNEGQLDEADAVCEQLRTDYPEVPDWLMRKAMVCEARGEIELAIEYCQHTIDWIDAHPEDFDPESRDPFHADIERLKNTAKDTN